MRLAFAGNDGKGRSDGMSFVWATNNQTATSVVRAGLSPDPSSMTITASGTQATYWQTWLHTAVITGLQAYVAPDGMAWRNGRAAQGREVQRRGSGGAGRGGGWMLEAVCVQLDPVLLPGGRRVGGLV